MSQPQLDPVLDSVVPFSQLTPRSIDWLWPSYLGFGKLAMLDGDPDQGKSFLALDLCARLSTGRPMPDGSPGPGIVPCLILQAEDTAEDTTLPRLRALGADLNHVHTWRDLFSGPQPMLLPTGLDLLEGALAKTGARFVVLDPIMAFLDQSVTTNSDQGVRRALSPLAHLLDRRGTAALMVRHFNKQGGTRAIYRGGGSIGLVAACRSGWLVGRDPQFPERRILAQIKNNLAGLQPSLAYELAPHAAGPPTLIWHGTTPWTADQLLVATESSRRAPQRARACEFLADFLRDGPQDSRAVWTAAQRLGFSVNTLRRAKKKLGITIQRPVRDGVQRTYWLLPFQELPAPPQIDPELARFFAEQEKRFPPPSPLDT